MIKTWRVHLLTPVESTHGAAYFKRQQGVSNEEKRNSRERGPWEWLAATNRYSVGKDTVIPAAGAPQSGFA